MYHINISQLEMIKTKEHLNVVLLLILCWNSGETLCTGNSCSSSSSSHNRYLLYEVQPGEGFNLRRDVYLRVANLVKKLNEKENWTLVLPPWGDLYHWKNKMRGHYYPWRIFFDIPSLNKWIPVIEFNEFVSEHGPDVSRAVLLQHYAEGWNGNWEEKFDTRPCLEQHSYKQLTAGHWNVYLWGHDISIKNFSCVSYQGQATTITPLLKSCDFESSVLIDHAETLLHDEYGGQWYWSARRSMRFSSHLIEEAKKFRSKYLNSTDEGDYTLVNHDWREDKYKIRKAVGGPYVAVHLRRRDFVYARENEVPTLKSAARQIIHILKKQLLKAVFVATDAPDYEYEELKRFLTGYSVFRYNSDTDFVEQYGDGSVAIIDQIICSHARYFIGSYESTFSFRIQEEREILGFVDETTFNRLCGKNSKCTQPSKWKIQF